MSITLHSYLWIKGYKYRLYRVYEDSEFDEMKRYAERQRKRNKTRYFIKTFTCSELWIPTKKHALYLSKTITLNPINRSFP